jgi:hypothetical protein
MAPPYLTGTVYYQQDVGVVDVNTIIASIKALALAATPAWTNPGGGGTIKSPADASGRQMTIAFTRIAATNLEFTVTDGAGRTLTKRAQIAGAGSTVNYFIGQFHMVLDWMNGATPEGIYCIMLDESPETQTSHNRWVVAASSRNAADALDNGWQCCSIFIVQSANTFALLQNCYLIPAFNAQQAGFASGGLQGKTIGGSNIWFPCIAMSASIAANNRIYGRLYQCLLVKGTSAGIGVEVSVPIDQSSSVIMKVLQMPLTGTPNDRFAVRKT